MVTSSKWMFNGVHSNTSDLWPAVTFDLVLVVSTSGLQHWLVNSTTTGDDTNSCSASGIQNLLGSTWQLDSSFASVGIVRDDDTGVARCFSQFASVANVTFDGTTSGTFWHGSDLHNVANVKGSFFTAIDGLASGQTFNGDHGFHSLSVFVRILKLDFGQWSTSARVMNDVFDNTFHVAMSFSIIQRSVLGSSFS